MIKHITLPLSEADAAELKAGDEVLLSGTLYTARDAAHKRMFEALKNGEALPFELSGQTIYYMGPSPTPPGKVIGAAGPTTSHRMDAYTPALLDAGLKGMIGKGRRTPPVLESIKKNGAVYFAAIGGAGALLQSRILKNEPVAYADLGPEAVRKLYVEDFPVTVAVDSGGNDLYNSAGKTYAGRWKKKEREK